MALSDEITSRYSSQYLIQITNPQASSQTTIDTTRLGKAATDVQSLFEVEGAGEYDGTDANHVAVAIEGVIALLLERTGHSSEEAAERKRTFLGRLRALRKIDHADKVVPTAANENDDLFARFPRRAIRQTKPKTPFGSNKSDP